MLSIRNFLKTLKIEYFKIKNMSHEFDSDNEESPLNYKRILSNIMKIIR